MIGAKTPRAKPGGQVTLKAVAERLGLTPGTVSAVLNNTKAARTIPENTRKRIIEAARQMNYRPNFLARSLRVRRTYTVGVIVEEIGDAYGSLIVGGIEPFLRESNFFFLTVAHRHNPKLLRSYSQLLISRGVEGLITIDTSIDEEPDLPTVAVAGHQRVKNVTNIILDHYRAAELGLLYLKELGHEHIAFLRGLPQSSDSASRWEAIEDMARRHNIQINPELVLQIEGRESTPELGYPYGKMLLERKIPFTALFAYNDISALGAMRAFQEAGRRVPDDISVVGFDDVAIASYSLPTLTTIRQPLEKMGRIAAQTLLDRIEERTEFVPEIAVEPELVVRQSAGPPSKL
ncbi:MAG TPA: LacI family DNA-binding transcriptional regulator [Candidatus Eremiobacteraceae bacterium]|nr:LacI family DNA-binding transcriptional regulator [Candidatus Eremiobacteraceae bacterium]